MQGQLSQDEFKIYKKNWAFVYVILMVYYTLQYELEFITVFGICFSLLWFTQIVTNHFFYFTINLIFLCIDLIIKILIVLSIFPNALNGVLTSVFDTTLVTQAIKLNFIEVNSSKLLFSLAFFIICILGLKSADQQVQYREDISNPVHQQIAKYLNLATPVCLYILCYFKKYEQNFTLDWLQKILWGISAAIYMQTQVTKPHIRSLLICLVTLLSLKDVFQSKLKNSSTLLEQGDLNKVIFQGQIYEIHGQIMYLLKILILINFRYKRHLLTYVKRQKRNSAQDSVSESSQSYTIRKKINSKKQLYLRNTILVYIFTILIMTFTNSISNIIVLFAVFNNVPQHVQYNFRVISGIGISFGLIFQPNQMLYFVLLYIMSIIKGQDHKFTLHSHWILIQISRLYILFSKVSVINFLMGLFESYTLVFFSLTFRICLTYLNIISVFMGTQQKYEVYLIQGWIPFSIITDIPLWIYMLMLKTYSPKLRVTFYSSNITNVFEQYPVIPKVEIILKVLKIVHLLAYISISFIILRNQPSFFILLRIIILAIMITTDVVLQKDKSTLRIIWKINLYVSLMIAFVKYFYLLNSYSNLSDWLIALLNPLSNNRKWIGLVNSSEVLLLQIFFSDVLIIILTVLVIFTLDVKIYQEYREIVFLDQNLMEKKQEADEQKEQNVKKVEIKNIHYLYRKYIKQIQLNLREDTIWTRILSDFFIEIYLSIVFFIYAFLESQEYKWVYIPHFLMISYVLIKQEDRIIPSKYFAFSIAYSAFMIISLYFRYVSSKLAQTQFSYDLIDMVSKYLIFLVACSFHQIFKAISLQHRSLFKINSQRRSNMLYSFIIPNIQASSLKNQIVILIVNCFKSLLIGYFMSFFFNDNTEVIIFNVLMGAILLFVLKYGNKFFGIRKQQILKTKWVYPLIITFLFSIWIRQFQGLVGIIFIRLYLLFEFQYQFNINLLYCQYMSQHQKQLVQGIYKKFNTEEKNKLSIILEQKPGVSNAISENQQKSQLQFRWQYLNVYKTFLWILPIVALLVIAFSSLLTIFNYLSAFLTLIILSLIFVLIKYIENVQFFVYKISVIIWLYLIIATLNCLRSFFFFQVNKNLYNQQIFLLYFGYVFFNQITSSQLQSSFGRFIHSKTFIVNFVMQRSRQAIQYWKDKSKLVSQLGSQIHNQKKLIKLQKYYVNKENISYKVDRLIQEIQQRSKQVSLNKSIDFDNIDNIITFKEEDKKYQLFSNMLFLLSQQDLIFCLCKFNQYYKPSKDAVLDYKIVDEMKQVRSQVLSTYHGSIQSAFLKFYEQRKNISEALKKQNQIEKLKISIEQEKQQKKQEQILGQFSSSENDTSQQSKANIQKQQQMIEQNYKCIQRIHQKALQISWFLRKVIQNSQVVGLVIVTGWNFFGGVYTIPINIVIFAWAVVLQTKTTVVFWSFIFIYATLIIFLKELLVSSTNLPVFNFIFYYHKNGNFYQFLIIIVCCIQIFLLKVGGTQNRAYSQIESIYDSFYRKALNKVANKLTNNEEQSFVQVYKTLSQPTKHSFIYRVFSKSRLKPGKDYYPLMAGIQLVILLYIFFFYDLMEFQSKNNIKSLEQILTVTQFSKNMMVILFTQVMIIIIDRFIVSLNFIDQKNRALQNFFLNFAFSQNLKYKAPEDLTHVGIFDVLLIVKYLFHLFLLILINFFVYFYIPSAGFQKSLIQTCETSQCNSSYTYLSIFLLLYLSYFLVSGLQIKHGFNRNKCKNTLMENFHYINYYLYVCFTAIPFLWQFKKICDWTITTTALPLFHWMKFEDINARLYQSKCQAEMLKIKPRGKTPWSKYLIGPSGCLFILCLVFSPIVIYSSLNPFAVNDLLIASQVNLNLVVGSSNTYKFFSTSHSIIYNQSSVLTQNQLQYFQYADQMKTTIDLENYNEYVLKMSTSPDQIFKLSEPAVKRLAQNIKNSYDNINQNAKQFQFELNVKIIEKEGGQTNIQWAQKTLQKKDLKSLYNLLVLNSTTLIINNFYSPIPGELQNQSIILVSKNYGEYFELYTLGNKTNQVLKQNQEMLGIMLFFKSATKYKIGFSLVTFYVTYVLLISRLFRVYLTGDLNNVIYQGCQFQRMLVLCDAVRSARILQNLYQQEYLYSFLIDMMRSPRTLKAMTGTFLQLRDKQQIS